jgi:hypothetical protein
VLLQLPQRFGLRDRSKQPPSVVSHSVNPGKQAPTPHVPPEQVAKRPVFIWEHLYGQLPQWSGFVARLTHESPQVVSGGEHAATQPLGAHFSPGWQTLLHEPQVAGFDRSASHPFAGSPSQSNQPGWHVPMAHAPEAQVAAALGSEHGWHPGSSHP